MHFHHCLPYVLLQHAPGIAAYHASRHKATDNDSDRDWCVKCGAYLLDGAANIRIRRTKTTRVLQYTCRSCSHLNLIPVAQSRPDAKLTPALISPSTSRPPSPPPKPTPLPPASHAKPRPKRKSGLQDMLARNRAIAEKQTPLLSNAEQPLSGLAAFLREL